ncbi:TIGR02147 family protein [Bdellovibrio sp. HCB337]|uniref:TIGR02147 family protein n=1 Tax=Bdellovibrio sp. HCB337 TaxID=3394358 RepID=UPI0039A414A7
MVARINVFQYQDYRQLLLALIEQRKKDRKPFSYRWFSQRAGLTSPNFLNLVVKGKRHLSTESLEKVVEIFQLNKDEGHFFRHLVHFNKAKTLSEKEHFARQLLHIKKFQNEYPLSKEQFEYYSKWYHIPIRELLMLKDAPQTEDEIHDLLLPSVSRPEIQEALEKLEALQLIEKKKDRWQVRQESVSTGHKFSNFGVVQYHKKMLNLAAESLDRFPAQEREISSVSIGLSEETAQKIKKMIEEFRSQLIAVAEEDKNKERVYQINFQLFPLSKRNEK